MFAGFSFVGSVDESAVFAGGSALVGAAEGSDSSGGSTRSGRVGRLSRSISDSPEGAPTVGAEARAPREETSEERIALDAESDGGGGKSALDIGSPNAEA